LRTRLARVAGKENMDHVLLACVGQRDLQQRRDSGMLEPLDKKTLRQKSEEIFHELDAWRERLACPMLMAALREMTEKYTGPGKGGEIQVVLLASDQEDVSHRHSDTIYCARILEKCLPFWTKKELDIAIRVKKVLELHHRPNRYDQMWEEIETWLDRARMTDDARFYVLLAGGTPAQNLGLLLAAVRRFGDCVDVLTVDEQATRATPLRVGRKLLRAFEEQKLAVALEHWDFNSARGVLSPESSAARCASAAVARLLFDFENSRDILEALQDRFNSPPEGWDMLLDETRALAHAARKDAGADSWGRLMREIYWNAWIKWQREEYADFLGRLWRLQEAALQTAVSWVVGIDLRDKHKSEKKFIEWVQGMPSLLSYLKDREAPDKEIRVQYNTMVFQYVLDWAVTEGSLQPDQLEKARRVRAAVHKLEPLRSLRNRSILAHDLEPVTRKRIRDSVQADPSGENGSEDPEAALFRWMEDLLEAWNAPAGSNPYAQYRELIRTLHQNG